MKKLLALICAFLFCVSIVGCGDNKPTTEEVDKAANAMKDTAGDFFMTPSEAVKKVMVGTWNETTTNTVYDMKADGTGTRGEEAFTFECGFDADNNITLLIKVGEAEEIYAMTTDTTGYGVKFESLKGGKDFALFPAHLTRLDMADEKAKGIVGEWSDKSGNQYIFEKDSTMIIDDKEEKTKGTYSVVENEEGTLLLNIVVPGGALEYEYTLSENDTVIDLRSPGTDVVHRWTK